MSTVVFKKPEGMTDRKLHYCPGCAHGIVHRLVAECVAELGQVDNTIITAPVGCSVFIPNYFTYDTIHCAHGRAPATATGIKRVHPDKLVITYQGDGDLASIGTAEIVHCAARGEKLTTIFINNGIYGMTGGQMAPTTLPVYIERVSVDSAPNVIKAKKAIKKALECQMKGLGYSFVEVVSSCPTNWGMTPVKAMEFVREKMIPYYPLGVYKDLTEEAK